MPQQLSRNGRIRLHRALLLTWMLAALAQSSWSAQAAPGPTHYRVGAYITAIHSLNVADGTFDADLWVWSVGPDPKRQPLQTMEFVNANKVEGSLDSTIPRGKLFWRGRKIAAKVRHHWDLTNYPFDRQILEIRMEDGTDDTSVLVYDPDIANTAYSKDVKLQGWRITGFRTEGGKTRYNSTFGDPTLSSGASSDYSRLSVFLSLRRSSYAGFFKLTSAVYAALLLALVSFFLDPEVPTILSARMSLLAGSLFATVISMRSASTALASDNGLTLVDKIHVTILAYVLAATGVAVLSRLHVERGGNVATVRRQNIWLGAIFTLLITVVNGLLIAQAIHAG